MGDPELRNRIVEHAMVRFMSAGYRYVRTDDLAVELGISKKTIYRLFRTKEELLREALKVHLSAIEAEIIRIFEVESYDFAERFTAMIAMLNRYLAPLSGHFLSDLVRSLPEVWREIDTFRRSRVFPRFEELFDSGQRQGYVREDLNVKLLVAILIEMIQTTVTPEKLNGYGASFHDVIAVFKTVLFRGVLSEEGRRYLEVSNDEA